MVEDVVEETGCACLRLAATGAFYDRLSAACFSRLASEFEISELLEGGVHL